MKEMKMDIPETGAVFTLGKSYLLADNQQSYFFVKNDPVRKLICGYKQSAVICESGRLFVWGDNKCGQLGIGITDSTIISKPTCVKFIKALKLKVENVAFGGDFSIILTDYSKIFYCGKNIFPFNSKIESLEAKFIKSSENFEYSIVPLELSELRDILRPDENILDIQAGVEHFVVLTDKHRLWGWGVNSNFALGNVDSHKILSAPVPFQITENVLAVRCGPYSTIAVTDKNNLLIFGNMKGNILFKPHEIVLKSSISSFDVSLTDEIFLITDKGKLLRSNQFKKIDDVMVEFVDFLKAEDEKIQQIVCGDSFVGILTESGRLYTNLSEDDGHSVDELQELSKFKNMIVTQCEAGKEHMLLHVLQHAAETVIPSAADVISVGQRMMAADTKVRHPSIDTGTSIDSDILKTESIYGDSSPSGGDSMGNTPNELNEIENMENTEEKIKPNSPIEQEGSHNDLMAIVVLPPSSATSCQQSASASNEAHTTPVEQMVHETIMSEMPASPKQHELNETFTVVNTGSHFVQKNKKHMLEKISAHKRLDFPDTDDVPYCQKMTCYENYILSTTETAEKETAEKVAAEKEAVEIEATEKEATNPRSPKTQNNVNIPFYQQKTNCEDTALYASENKDGLHSPKTPTVDDDTSESVLPHHGSEATTMDVDSRNMSNLNTPDPEIIATSSPQPKTTTERKLAEHEENLEDVEIPEIPSKMSSKDEDSENVGENVIRYINNGIDVTETILKDTKNEIVKKSKKIPPLRPEVERVFLGDELTEKNAPPKIKNLKSQTQEFLKQVTLEDCRGQEEDQRSKRSSRVVRQKTPIPTIKKIDEFNDAESISSQSTFNESDYSAEEYKPPKVETVKKTPKKKLGFVRQFFQDLKDVRKELSCKNTDTVVPEAQTRPRYA